MNMTTQQPPVRNTSNRADILGNQGINPYPHEFARSCSFLDVYMDYHYVDKQGEEVDLMLCGRVMNIRSVGKLHYVILQDIDRELQFFLGLNSFSAEDLESFCRLVERGDWIGFKVNLLYRTHSGDLTAQVVGWSMLAPCLLTLPQSIKSSRRQLQQRSTYLACEPTARTKLIAHSKTLHRIRHFLEEDGFLEVKTPSVRPAFRTETDSLSERFDNNGSTNIRPSHHTKSYLKQLVIAGMDAVYEIYDSYNDETVDWIHYPVSQTLECCRFPADISDIIGLTERLIMGLVTEHRRTLQLAWYPLVQLQWLAEYRDDIDMNVEMGDSRIGTDEALVINFALPWERRSVFGLVQEVTGIDFLSVISTYEAIEIAKSTGVEIDADLSLSTVGAVALYILDKLVIPTLVQPTLIVDHPFEEFPWAKRNRHDPRLAETFELIINGIRFAEGGTEQNDPREQVAQLMPQSENYPGKVDQAEQASDAYHDALWYGLPPTAGLKIDIDRLVMLITGATDLRDVIFFPIHEG